MVDSYSSLAPILEDTLGLQLPPVALSFVNDRPPDLPVLETTVPSACAVWMLAETEVFYAPASAHFNCPLGAMVMGFALPEPQSAGLQEELGMMFGIEYVREAELPHVPTVPNSPSRHCLRSPGPLPPAAGPGLALGDTPTINDVERVLRLD